jgi:hypothetical protein
MASNKLLKSVLIVLVLGTSSVICLVLYLVIYSFFLKPLQTFLTTSSPDKTYTVSLRGQKTQPIFFTAEVRYDVSKNGAPMLSNKFLSSADGLDFPFEFLYPNHRWIDEQTIQFYREENLRERPPDTVVVVNNTGKTLKLVRIGSTEIVLFFEMQPGFKDSIPSSQSKGDRKGLSVGVSLLTVQASWSLLLTLTLRDEGNPGLLGWIFERTKPWWRCSIKD